MGTTILQPGEHMVEHYHPYSEEFLYGIRSRADFFAWEKSDEHRELVRPMRECYTDPEFRSFAVEDIVRHMPGFVSANVHCSVDGTRVTNYAQWSDLDAFQQRIRSEAGRALIVEMHKYVDDVDVHVYDVDWTLAGEGA